MVSAYATPYVDPSSDFFDGIGIAAQIIYITSGLVANDFASDGPVKEAVKMQSGYSFWICQPIGRTALWSGTVDESN